MRLLLSNRKGISDALVVILFFAIAVVIAGVVLAYVTGFMPHGKTPVAQLTIYDYSESLSSGYSFVVKDLGGDSIPLRDLRVVAINVTNNQVVYSRIISQDLGNFTLVNIYGPANQSLDPGEKIIASNNVIRQAGTYEIKLMYEPTKQVIASTTITIQ